VSNIISDFNSRYLKSAFEKYERCKSNLKLPGGSGYFHKAALLRPLQRGGTGRCRFWGTTRSLTESQYSLVFQPDYWRPAVCLLAGDHHLPAATCPWSKCSPGNKTTVLDWISKNWLLGLHLCQVLDALSRLRTNWMWSIYSAKK